MTRLASAARFREVLLVPAAVAAGLAIAYLDSRPGWDSTGITASLLLLAAGITTALAGRRPWLWALLVGAWTPLLEVAWYGTRATGALAALGFAAVGALAGYAIIRWTRALAD